MKYFRGSCNVCYFTKYKTGNDVATLTHPGGLQASLEEGVYNKRIFACMNNGVNLLVFFGLLFYVANLLCDGLESFFVIGILRLQLYYLSAKRAVYVVVDNQPTLLLSRRYLL